MSDNVRLTTLFRRLAVEIGNPDSAHWRGVVSGLRIAADIAERDDADLLPGPVEGGRSDG